MPTFGPLDASYVDAVVALWERCGLTRPWNDAAADYLRAVTGDSCAVIGALDSDRLVGSVMVGDDGHRGWVYYLAVAPDLRQRGLGRQLMVAAEGWLGKRGVPKLNLMVRADNTDAAGFYTALGYEHDKVVVISKRLEV